MNLELQNATEAGIGTGTAVECLVGYPQVSEGESQSVLGQYPR